jgi:hypothetical protein
MFVAKIRFMPSLFQSTLKPTSLTLLDDACLPHACLHMACSSCSGMKFYHKISQVDVKQNCNVSKTVSPPHHQQQGKVTHKY